MQRRRQPRAPEAAPPTHQVDVKKATDPVLSAAVRAVIAAPECPLQPEEVFMQKVLSLQELFSVRHCVFVLGAAGSAKSQVWQTLARAQTSIEANGGVTKVGIPLRPTPRPSTLCIRPSAPAFCTGLAAQD